METITTHSPIITKIIKNWYNIYMSQKDNEITKTIKDVYREVRFGVLATQGKKSPYTCLIGYILSEDLKKLYFITSNKTRKFTNIKNNNMVSIMIDNRQTAPGKTYLITAITVMGEAQILKRTPPNLLKKYSQKHPDLTDFARSDNSRMINVNISKYIVVKKFQEVIELNL